MTQPELDWDDDIYKMLESKDAELAEARKHLRALRAEVERLREAIRKALDDRDRLWAERHLREALGDD